MIHEFIDKDIKIILEREGDTSKVSIFQDNILVDKIILYKKQTNPCQGHAKQQKEDEER